MARGALLGRLKQRPVEKGLILVAANDRAISIFCWWDLPTEANVAKLHGCPWLAVQYLAGAHRNRSGRRGLPANTAYSCPCASVRIRLIRQLIAVCGPLVSTSAIPAVAPADTRGLGVGT